MSGEAGNVTPAAKALGTLAHAAQSKVAPLVSVHTLISGEATTIIAHCKTEGRLVEFHTDIDAMRLGVLYGVDDGLTADTERRFFKRAFQATAPTGAIHRHVDSHSRGSFLGNRLERTRQVAIAELGIAHLPDTFARFSQRCSRELLYP